MEGLPDAAAFATKLKNTLIQYHSIEDDMWRVAKKTRDVTIWRKPSEEFNGYLWSSIPSYKVQGSRKLFVICLLYLCDSLGVHLALRDVHHSALPDVARLLSEVVVAVFKAQGIIDDVVNGVMDHICPGPCRLDWDSLMTSLDILESFEENCCVMRYTTAGQLWNIISPREFVDFSYTVDYEGGLLSCGRSLEWSEKRPEFVRGYNHPCGWFCVPLKDSEHQSLLTGYIQTDLRGMIPQSAVDTAMASTLINFYGDLRKALRKA